MLTHMICQDTFNECWCEGIAHLVTDGLRAKKTGGQFYGADLSQDAIWHTRITIITEALIKTKGGDGVVDINQLLALIIWVKSQYCLSKTRGCLSDTQGKTISENWHIGKEFSQDFAWKDIDTDNIAIGWELRYICVACACISYVVATVVGKVWIRLGIDGVASYLGDASQGIDSITTVSDTISAILI